MLTTKTPVSKGKSTTQQNKRTNNTHKQNRTKIIVFFHLGLFYDFHKKKERRTEEKLTHREKLTNKNNWNICRDSR